MAKVRDGIEFSEHIEGDGTDIFKTACELGHEGIVAKRKDLPYESGPVDAVAEDQKHGRAGSAADRGRNVLASIDRA